jgi:hypothetical protein
MSDVVTYIKNGTTYVVDNPTTPIAADAWFDQPRLDNNGDPELDEQNRVVVDRYVNRTSVDISNCVTSESLNTTLQSYALASSVTQSINNALSGKADASALDNYLPLSGGALTGAVTSSSVAQFNRVQETVVTANSGVFNCANGSYFIMTPSDDVSIAITNMAAGQTITIKIVNGGEYTIVYPSNWLWTSGSIPELQAEGTDLITLYYDGVNYIANAITGLATVE